MPSIELDCWRCGATQTEVLLPMSRREECTACGAQLHVCRMCQFYDPKTTTRCREERAEEVSDKERANFCDYFKPRPDAFKPRDHDKARDARAKLEDLFGMDAGGTTSPGAPDIHAERDAARENLERLFGLDKKDDK
jgi:hypothetical protein